jgi:hypothetical protein
MQENNSQQELFHKGVIHQSVFTDFDDNERGHEGKGGETEDPFPPEVIRLAAPVLLADQLNALGIAREVVRLVVRQLADLLFGGIGGDAQLSVVSPARRVGMTSPQRMPLTSPSIATTTNSRLTATIRFSSCAPQAPSGRHSGDFGL